MKHPQNLTETYLRDDEPLSSSSCFHAQQRDDQSLQNKTQSGRQLPRVLTVTQGNSGGRAAGSQTLLFLLFLWWISHSFDGGVTPASADITD